MLGRSPRWVRAIYIANLVAQMGIVVTGAVVRITGSGLGCPTWPECVEGSITPTSTQAEAWQKYVEFGNRLLTFVLVILAVASIVAALADRSRRRRSGLAPRPALTVLAFTPIVGTFAQALLGGITVLTGLHPAIVGAHFLLSMAIIAGCVALVARSADQGDSPITWLVPRAVTILTWLLVAAGAVVVLLGVIVTGSGPHGGDADNPTRFGFDPRTVSWLHADVVLLFIGLMIGLLVSLYVARGPSAAIRRAWILVGVAMLQGAVGYTQYFTGLPEVLVGIHVLGATIVWVSVLSLPSALRSRGVAAMAGTGPGLPAGTAAPST